MAGRCCWEGPWALLPGRGTRAAASDSGAESRYLAKYVARKATPPVIDGDVFKPEWERASWSEPFVEIRGVADAPPGTGPTQAQETRMKMLWDENFLYVAAVMDVAAGDELVAKFTERNAPIFHTDSDFEVFIDPAGSNHGYKELEMNALNTVWNLMLNRPYSVGGGEYSGRVAKPGEAAYWEVTKQRTAVRVLQGKLHDASRPSRWCCEIALAHEDTLSQLPASAPRPAVGRCWRINFSRVEKGGSVNWVWTPQIVWSPQDRRYKGEVNMHLPDAWGYVVFADEAGRLGGGLPSSCWQDPMLPVRQAAFVAYYAVRAYREAHGKYPASWEDERLQQLVDANALAQVQVSLRSLDDNGFVIEVSGYGYKAELTHERHFQVWETDVPPVAAS